MLTLFSFILDEPTTGYGALAVYPNSAVVSGGCGLKLLLFCVGQG